MSWPGLCWSAGCCLILQICESALFEIWVYSLPHKQAASGRSSTTAGASPEQRQHGTGAPRHGGPRLRQPRRGDLGGPPLRPSWHGSLGANACQVRFAAVLAADNTAADGKRGRAAAGILISWCFA